MEARANSFLETGKIGVLMRRYAVPCVISLVVAAVQNMSTKYGALAPVFGQPAFSHIPLAVLGIVMMFFQIVISISVGMAAGPGSCLPSCWRPPPACPWCGRSCSAWACPSCFRWPLV